MTIIKNKIGNLWIDFLKFSSTILSGIAKPIVIPSRINKVHHYNASRQSTICMIQPIIMMPPNKIKRGGSIHWMSLSQ